jgi:hypothetical protein
LFVCACSPNDASNPPNDFNPYNPSYPHILRSDTDDDITEFANKHKEERIVGLVMFVMHSTAKGFSRLSQLKGLYALSLSGADLPSAHKYVEVDGMYYFKPILDDDQVQEIAKIKSLRVLEMWYGSLTTNQKSLLQKQLPNCKLHDNLNKI